MSTRFAIACDDDKAQEVTRLAHRFGLTEEQVIMQLIDLGLESLEETTLER